LESTHARFRKSTMLDAFKAAVEAGEMPNFKNGTIRLHGRA
jgi:hypothetical protein